MTDEKPKLSDDQLCHICLSNADELMGYVRESEGGIIVYLPMKVIDLTAYEDGRRGTFLDRYAAYSDDDHNFIYLSGYHVVSYTPLSSEMVEFYKLNIVLDNHEERLDSYKQANEVLKAEIVRREKPGELDSYIEEGVTKH